MRQLFSLTAALLVATNLFAACGSNNNKSNNDDKQKTVAVEQKGEVLELSSEDFNTKVFDTKADGLTFLGDRPAIVDFNATWCGPCRQIAPILEELAAEYDGQIVIYKVDVDKCRDIAEAFGISSIPAILYIPMEGEPQMTVGSRSKAQFNEEIGSILLKK